MEAICYGISAAPSTAYLPHDLPDDVRHNNRMGQIEVLIVRIATKLSEIGLTEREASIDATGKPDAIRYIRTRRAMPSADRLQKIAETLRTTPEWLLGREGATERAGEQAALLPDFKHLIRDLPVLGTALGADVDLCSAAGEMVAVEQTELSMAGPQDYMARPTAIAGRPEFYVVTVAGSSMVPKHAPGRRLLVDSKRSPMIGDDVVVQLVAPLEDGDREYTSVLVKELVKRKAKACVLHQYNPDFTFEVPNERIAAIHRVMPWDEALGL